MDKKHFLLFLLFIYNILQTNFCQSQNNQSTSSMLRKVVFSLNQSLKQKPNLPIFYITQPQFLFKNSSPLNGSITKNNLSPPNIVQTVNSSTALLIKQRINNLSKSSNNDLKIIEKQQIILLLDIKNKTRQTQLIQNIKNNTLNLRYLQYLMKYKPIQQYKQNNDIKTYRQGVLQQNIRTMNNINKNKLKSFTTNINKYTDLSGNQFSQSAGRLMIPLQVKKQVQSELQQLKNKDGKIVYKSPPNIKIDWSCLKTYILVTGQCNTSYVLSALQTIELSYRILISDQIGYLSIQQIISCAANGKEIKGCEGGFYRGVFDYVAANGVGKNPVYFYDDKAKFQGIATQCNKTVINSQNYKKSRIFIKQSKRIRAGDCQQIVRQLKFRTITVAIASAGFQFYDNGIFKTTNKNIDHAVTLVGYTPNIGYLIKNIWGSSWGIGGYGYVDQSTGVCNYGIYPVFANQNIDQFNPPDQRCQ